MGWLSALPVVGDVLNMVSQHSTDQANRDIAGQANLTAQQNNAAQQALSEKNIQLQEDFAKNGIQWRVADAEKAGLSPLVGAGVSEPSYSPVSMNIEPPVVGHVQGYGRSFSELGQDVSRALAATQSPEDRTAQALSLEHQQLENDLLRTQIVNSRIGRMNSAQLGPGIPVSDHSLMIDRDGYSYSVPSEAYARDSRGMLMPNWRWSLNNGFMDFRDSLHNLWQGSDMSSQSELGSDRDFKH